MQPALIDILWVLFCAGLVFNMQIGFLCLESGLTRSKNAINVALKNIADLSVAVLLYWLLGFGLMFGSSVGGWFGSSHFLQPSDGAEPWPAAFFLFQALFCSTAATIVSGAAAERMRFNAYLLTTALAAALIYPLFGHWAWAGNFSDGAGWLAERGFIDFAGSSVVHSVGGCIALAVILVIGARKGRFTGRSGERSMPGSSLPLAMLGSMLLLFGWFGFNGGSTFSFDPRVPGIMTNTLLGGAAGIFGAMLFSQLRFGCVDAVWPMNGMLAGLVSITAAAHAISALDAILIGFIGSLAMVTTERLLVRLRIDDAVGAVPVHLAAGIWGTLSVALFGDLEMLAGNSRSEQLLIQLEGVLICAIWAFGLTYMALRILNRFYPMRVDDEDERRGLNVSEHGSRTELIELLEAMEEHQRQGNFNKEVPTEPFTEVGQIAEQYNKVIRALRLAIGKTQSIIRDIRDGVVTINGEGILATCNPGAERLFGLRAEQIIGRPLQQLFVAEKAWSPTLLPEPGGEVKREVMLRNHRGENFAAELTVSRGALDHSLYTCIVRDITERRRIEEQLFQEKMLAQVTLASIGDGVISTDHAGNILFLNPVAEQLTGWRCEEVRGKPLQEAYQLFDEASGMPLGNSVHPVFRRSRTRTEQRKENSPAMLRRRNNTPVAVQDAVAPIKDSEGRIIGAVLTFRDVTDTHRLSRELSFQASHDALTGLANRIEFERRLAELLQPGHADEEHVLCYMDLDQFKVVNDTCGHAAGDELLRQLARFFRTLIRSSDVLARLGGDEFGILFINCPLQQALQISESIRALVDEFRFSWDGKSFAVGVSIGLVRLDEHERSLGGLLAAADSACYAAKDGGRNRVHVYQADDQHLLERRGEMQWTGRIRQALDADRFRLFVQPIMALSDGSVGPRYEVLVRMLGDDGGIIAPGSFMPAAERYDLAPAIDRWVVGNFLAWMGDFCRRRPRPYGHYSINLSAASLGEDGLLDFILKTIEHHRIPTDCLCFEITETSVIANLSQALKFMEQLKGIGCSFALDDFGSGLSSFAYLRTLPVDYLKIDGAFVRDLEQDPIARAMVASINSIGHEMGLRTVAEFVESEAILDCLRDIGVDYGQGYHLGRPHPLSDLSGVHMMPR